jgi:hypothetical protein
MTVSALVHNVACRDPHFDVMDVLTYIVDKGAETRIHSWPISARLGSLAVREGMERRDSEAMTVEIVDS